MDEERRAFTIDQAAAYLGLSRGGLEYHLRQGNIKPDAHVGHRPVFSKATLDAHKIGRRQTNYRGDVLYTSAEAARVLGISRSLFSYHYVRGHVKSYSVTRLGHPLFLERDLESLRIIPISESGETDT